MSNPGVLPSAVPSPSRLSEAHWEFLVEFVRDWQYQHGSLLKYPPRSGLVASRPIGATLFPSNFPKQCYDEALAIQPIFNKLYAAISEDEEWLYNSLKALIESPKSMAKILWEIHCAVKSDGYVQDLSLGVFRSDYMLHEKSSKEGGDAETKSTLVIKQVEFNTYSVAGGAHGNRISDMHKYFHTIGAYGLVPSISDESFPVNHTVQSIAAGLAMAHNAYGPVKSKSATRTGVLMVVQPNNVNICDERPYEEALWKQGIPSYRVEFGDAVLASTVLTDTRELLFSPPNEFSEQKVEISVIYQRAGYDVEEYNDSGLEARYQLEKSRAIKAPSLLCHLATLKVIQQQLSLPQALERFLDAHEAERIRATFMPMWPLDDSPLGREGQKMARDSSMAASAVLKPSLEGGGHNIYKTNITGFLKNVPVERVADYILMELIKSPHVHNALLTFHGLYSGPVISELGIFGTCLWRKGVSGDLELLHNTSASTSLKTKKTNIDEMSVVKGYGCFDSPFLI